VSRVTGYVSHGENAGDNSVPSNKSLMQYTVCKQSCPVYYGYIIYSGVKYFYTNDHYLMTTVGTIKVLN